MIRGLAAGIVCLVAFTTLAWHDQARQESAAPPGRLPLAEPGVEGSIERLFLATEGRPGDGAALDQWVARYRDGEPLLQIGQAFAESPRFVRTYGSRPDADFVDRIYDDVIGRDPTPPDRAYWTSRLASGESSRAAVLVALSESPEHVARTGTPAPVAPRPLLAPAGIEHSIARIYLGLLRTWPDRATLDADVGQYLAGTPLTAIAGKVLASPDAATRYGTVRSDAFVRSLYTDVLGRVPDPAGLTTWQQRLDAGEARAAVAVALTESPEMLARSRTAPPLPAPIPHVLLAVGDSVMLGAVRTISAIPGWSVQVDARGCRQPTTRGDGCGAVDIPSGIDALRTARGVGHMGGAVVVQVGNNGPMSAEQFDAVMAEVADQRLVIALTLHEPRSYEAGNNVVISGATARWPNLRILDWHAAAAGHPEWFGDGEGIHLSGTGARAMADLIAAALPAY